MQNYQNLVQGLTNFGRGNGKDFSRFIQDNQFDLCKHTISPEQIVAFLKADDSISAKVRSEAAPADKNHIVYCLYIQKVSSPQNLIDALVATNNTKALEIIREALFLDESDSPQAPVEQNPGTIQKPAEKQRPKETYKCKNIRVLFINQKFDSDTKSKTLDKTSYRKLQRPGAEKDDDAIKTLFKTKLKMTLDIYRNVAKSQFEVILDSFIQNCIDDKNDGCIIIIGTHGAYPDFLLMDDLKMVNLESELIQKFEQNAFPEFKGCPKIFLLNACRNEIELEKEMEAKPLGAGDNYVNYSDILLCQSTLPFLKSYRSEQEGSCFIQSFCKIATENLEGNYEIRDLLHEVRQDVENYTQLRGVFQVSEIRDRGFPKNFCLKPQDSS